MWGMAILHAELYIHLLCAISCPSSCLSIGLPVCWSVSHSWRLSAYMTIHVSLCVYLYTNLSVSLFVFWSVYK